MLLLRIKYELKNFLKKFPCAKSLYSKYKILKRKTLDNATRRKINRILDELNNYTSSEKKEIFKSTNKKRVGFDSFAFLEDSVNRGVGRYTHDLIKSMVLLDDNTDYFFFNFGTVGCFNELLCKKNFHSVNIPLLNGDDISTDNNLYGIILRKLIKYYSITDFLITNPYNMKILEYKREWFGDSRISCILYDAIPYVYKEHYFNLSFPEIKKNYIPLTISIKKCCDHFFAISKCTKNDFINFFGFDSRKIEVIYSGFSENFKSHLVSCSQEVLIKNKFKIKKEFFLFVSGDDFRKNNELTLKAFSLLPRDIIDKYQLVIVCKLSFNTEKRLSKLCKDLHIENDVVFTNYVEEDSLIKLYNLCSFVVFPSLYEGFGLPVIEAYSCKKPVLTSNNSSLGEISKGSAIQVDPNSLKDISDGFAKLVKTDFSTMIENGYSKLITFNWETVANKCISYFNKKPSSHILNNKLAIFLSLPPLKSGISDYAVDLITELSKLYDIDVVIDDNYLPQVSFPKNVKIINHRNYKQSDYKDTIFEFGNNEFHVYMIPYILNSNSIIELHDSNLTELSNFVYYNKELYHFSNLLKINNKDFIIPLLCRTKCDFILHSEFAKNIIEKQSNNNILVVPLYSKELFYIQKKDSRTKLNIDLNEIAFSSFGFIHESKRVVQEIYAFKKLVRKYPDKNIKYYFVGENVLRDNFINKIKKLNLLDKIVITGFVNMDVFNLYLNSMDFHFNLRYPYNGETSGVLSRALSVGLPTIVYSIGSFNEFPSNIVQKINYSNISKIEINRIFKCMDDCIANPEKYEYIANNAKNYFEKNLKISQICHRLSNFINDRYFEMICDKKIASVIARKSKKTKNIASFIEFTRWINSI